MNDWYTLNLTEVLQRLGTDLEKGLNQSQVEQRSVEYGPNELASPESTGIWDILIKQLRASMVLLLIVAGIISLVLGDYTDAAAMFAIVIFNAVLGVKHEYKASKAIIALKKLAISTVKVLRNQQIQEISSIDLVPGDIVFLETGNQILADCRLIESFNLRVQESSLTGESAAVDKHCHSIPEASSVSERENMAYMGTTVIYGRGLAVVTATGSNTLLGQIALPLQTINCEPTPLERRLDRLGWQMSLVILTLVVIIFTLGLLRGEELSFMLIAAVSLAVAAVPEGLPAVVTITLALGAQRMFQKQALIRNLPAVETLGSVTTICSDKTGTLTQNRMDVAFVALADYQLSINTKELEGDFYSLEQPALAILLMVCLFCNDTLWKSEEDLSILGDPTEVALLVLAERWGLKNRGLKQNLPRVAEFPFDPLRQRMTTVHQMPTTNNLLREKFELFNLSPTQDYSHIAFSKGGVSSLLSICHRVWVEGEIIPIDTKWYKKILAIEEHLALEGMRVLGVAFRLLTFASGQQDSEIIENDLVFVGMLGLIDPIRSQARESVKLCQSAGIRPIIITGDHPLTAQHVARELGINSEILTGVDLDQLTEKELEEKIKQIAIYARVSPQHKLEIVKALQKQGEIVAMTGDGVNDAPALKQANIGIAMGISGTDVAKESADMVLLDDNFATIVSAIEEGRVIYDNTRKFIRYTLTGNCGELWVILIAPFLGIPFPLNPLQILWVNLLADGLLALALSAEPPEKGIMQHKPHLPNESIFSRSVGKDIFWVGLSMGLVLLGVAYGYWSKDRENWQTMVFTTLIFSRMGLVQTMRSQEDSLLQIGLGSNRPLLSALLLTLILQLLILYIPWLQPIFKSDPLSWLDLLFALILSSIVPILVELNKIYRRKRISL